jgi:SLOG cluster2
MNTLERPLIGCTVGLSISESEDSTGRGFPPWQVNRVTLQVVAALFGQGAGVIFGHDWREDGVMEAVHGFARQMQSPLPLSHNEAGAAGQPLLQNLLPWPDTPHLSQQDLDRLRSTLRVEMAGLPEELKPHQDAALGADPNSSLYRYMRARGLTHLRHRLNVECNARLCIGGRTSGSAGRFPGVIDQRTL